jgi:hypothetical protein
MKTHAASLAAALLLAACATSGAEKVDAPTGPPVFPQDLQVKATGAPGQAAATRYTHVGAKVKAIDVAARTITVETGDGQAETIKVAAEVANLGALGVGDVIHAEYDQGLVLEYQAEGSASVPLEIAAAASPAAGAAVTTVRATVTVTAVDLPSRTVEFTGPRGNRYRVTAGPKVALEKLKVGDRLLATYAEAFAVRLEKAGSAL